MKKQRLLLTALLALFAVVAGRADEVVQMRRPVDVDHPMFIVHIDTWNYPDPQKIIDLVPDDLKPWCVFNISLSVNHNETTGVWNLVRNGYETAKSWVRTCAENQVWCTVQPSSGGYSHFPDGDMTIYEEFYRDYPNFIGFNYCEQFWGFDEQFSVTKAQRLAHFAKLMDLSTQYGGYLIISWCGGIWHFDTDPVAMMKRNASFKAACQQHPDNLILCFKYTSAANWYNNESVCLGTFISGLTNNYGVRYDECGWALADGETYPTAVGLSAVMENTQLTGMTVFDGPELIWRQCFREAGTTQTADGYTSRHWERFPQFENIWFDFYRKILDGTLRIPTRKDVMEKTQLCILQDVSSGSSQDQYATPPNLYDGLYKQDGEGNLQENTHWFKKTGRYGAIPVVVGYYDQDAQVIPVRVRASQFKSKWSTVQDKVNELNQYAPEEYEGTLYVGRMKNAWVTYYPFRYGTSAWARIPFQFNTCERMELDYAEYSSGLIHEYQDHVDFYLNNYRVDSTALKTDEIRIYGSTSQPTMTWQDRASHQQSKVTATWEDGVYIVKVSHCGAVELSVSCAGTRGLDDTSVAPSPQALAAPALPEVYTGPRQYEAECFDYKNISQVVTRPSVSGVLEGHVGQGYLAMGTSTSAMVKDTVNVPADGTYRLTFRYQAPSADARHTALLVNTTAIRNGKRMEFAKTDAGVWATLSQEVTLHEGDNVVYLRANSNYGTPQPLYLDNLVVEAVDDASTILTSPFTFHNPPSTSYPSLVYDLQGRPIVNGESSDSKLPKGMYIRDGKVFVVR